MKKIFNFSIYSLQWKLMFSALAIIFLNACKEEEDRLPALEQSIAQNIVNDNNFSLLEAALRKTNLLSALEAKDGSFTIFAPIDSAFKAAGFQDEAAINSADVNALTEILQRHVLNQEVNRNDLKNNQILTTLNNGSLFVNILNRNITINNVPITAASRTAENGIIQPIIAIIPSLALPTAQTIPDYLASNPNFSLLNAAISKAGLTDALKAAGPFTIFAPTNTAFVAAGFKDIAAINAAPVAKLEAVLRKHVIGSKKTAVDLKNGEIITPLNTSKRLAISKSGGTVKVNGTSVISADIPNSNGIVHAINEVISETSILDAAANTTTLSLLVTAVANVSANTSTNVAELLAKRSTKAKGGLTVFAPDNDAFTTATLTKAFLENKDNAEGILEILAYHVIGTTDSLTADKFKDTTTMPVRSLAFATFGGNNIFINKRAGDVIINGYAEVTTPDLKVDSGLVHVIDNILIPPIAGNVVEYLSEEGFTSLLRVVEYVDANTRPSANLAATLSGAGFLTVFAPTNIALNNLIDGNRDGFLSKDELDVFGAPALAAILQRHVVKFSGRRTGVILSSDLSNGQVIPVINGTLTLNLGTLTLTPVGGTPAPAPVNANIIDSDIIATNGVIHVIDDVLR